VALLVVSCALSSFVMTLCVPALPAMRDALGVSDAGIQWLISGFLLSLAVMQPLHGVLTDRLGRRPVMLAGYAVAVLGSVLAALAATLPALILARVIQGAGIATGTVVARAMVRDIAGGDEGARIMSCIAIGMGVAPTLAPLLSGFLVQSAGWQSTFWAAAAACAAVLAWLALALPETRPRALRRSAAPESSVLADLLVVAGSPLFWGYALMFGLGNAAFFAFLTNGPAFFLAVLGDTPAGFGLYMGGLSAAYVLGATLGSRLSVRLGMRRTLRIGVSGTSTAVTLLLLASAVLPPARATVLAPMALLFVSAGLVNPAAMTGAVVHFPRQAGTASGVSGSVGMGLGAVGAMVSARFIDDTMASLAWPIAVSIYLSLAAFLLVLLAPVPGAGAPAADVLEGGAR